ncbi:MAG: Ligand-binding SRPBCC domain protein family, partial [uncultured Frankineae bacterium]
EHHHAAGPAYDPRRQAAGGLHPHVRRVDRRRLGRLHRAAPDGALDRDVDRRPGLRRGRLPDDGRGRGRARGDLPGRAVRAAPPVRRAQSQRGALLRGRLRSPGRVAAHPRAHRGRRHDHVDVHAGDPGRSRRPRRGRQRRTRLGLLPRPSRRRVRGRRGRRRGLPAVPRPLRPLPGALHL